MGFGGRGFARLSDPGGFWTDIHGRTLSSSEILVFATGYKKTYKRRRLVPDWRLFVGLTLLHHNPRLAVTFFDGRNHVAIVRERVRLSANICSSMVKHFVFWRSSWKSSEQNSMAFLSTCSKHSPHQTCVLNSWYISFPWQFGKKYKTRSSLAVTIAATLLLSKLPKKENNFVRCTFKNIKWCIPLSCVLLSGWNGTLGLIYFAVLNDGCSLKTRLCFFPCFTWMPKCLCEALVWFQRSKDSIAALGPWLKSNLVAPNTFVCRKSRQKDSVTRLSGRSRILGWRAPRKLNLNEEKLALLTMI